MNSPWPAITLTTPNGATATLFEHGAHLTHWRSVSGKPWLFTSKAAVFANGQPIRGGVPIVFPQFNQFGPGPKHGFLRNVKWQVQQPPTQHQGQCECILTFDSNSDSHMLWPHDFAAQFLVALADTTLTMQLSIHNTGNQPFEFSAALHTYFAIAALQHTRLSGLKEYAYWDNGTPFEQRQTFAGTELNFNAAIDRVFFNVTQPLHLHDGNYSLRIEQTGFNDVVVWNPGEAGAKTIADLDPCEFPNMLCVEAAAIEHKIRLNPKERWLGVQKLTERAD